MESNLKFAWQHNWSSIQIQDKNWVGGNNDASGTYNVNNQTKFKNTMLMHSFYSVGV